MDLLRIATAGSVDAGKSLLVGRLLYETGSVYADQLAQIDAATRRRGESRTNLALIADGLRAEREQDITIDVAHKYFRTPRRAFIIADTPGHVQYTRNMVTGASTADVAVVVIDVTTGATTQSRRHAFVASLLGLPHVLFAVNKMDLVSYEAGAYDAVVAEVSAFADRLTVQDVSFIPVSALEGDNVVTASPRMPWFAGGPLLHRLETIKAGARRNTVDFRFPVQQAIRTPGFRGCAGTAASGSLAAGAEVVVLPSGALTRVRSIETFDGPRERVHAGEAVVLTMADELDVGRGDMIVPRRNVPALASRLDAYVCWMASSPLAAGAEYLLLHTTRQVRAVVERIEYRVDVDTLHRVAAADLGPNDIGRVEIATSQPIACDSYRVNWATGSFILIDRLTNGTVAAGMIRGAARYAGDRVAARAAPAAADGSTTDAGPAAASRAEREARQGHRAAIVWLTGLPGSGKTTIARLVERRLFERGCRTLLLDGDEVRQGLCRDLGFSPEDRAENIRRAGEVAKLCFEQGSLVLCAFISPYRSDRDRIRALVPGGRFIEVYVKAEADICRARDPKHLYARAAAGEVPGFTGVSAPYEEPLTPELVLETATEPPQASARALLAFLQDWGVFRVDRRA
jgi:bifunctional enzyme CysN/CysC